MTQTITTQVSELVAKAKSEVEELTVAEVAAAAREGDIQLIDIRDVRELARDGRIPGAFHCPRGMLEFWIDPASTYHKDVFAKDTRYVFLCAGGMRSALAAKTAQDMGLSPVAHMLGGFGAWSKDGQAIEKDEKLWK